MKVLSFMILLLVLPLCAASCSSDVILYLDGEKQDSSGNDFNVDFANVQTARDGNTAPRSQAAYVLSGKKDSYIRIPPEVLKSRYKFSISLWVKTSDPSPVFFSIVDSLGRDEFKLDAHKPVLRVKTLMVKTDTRISDNQWHNLVVSADIHAGEYKVYIDGTLAGEREIRSYQSRISSSGFIIGFEQKAGSVSGKSLTGQIDEVVISDRIYSSEEISANFANGASFCDNEAPVFQVEGGEGNNKIQIYRGRIRVDGKGLYSNPDGAVLNGNAGDDVFVSVGSGSQTIRGGEGFDSFWVDSTDIIEDASSEEISGGNVHVIEEYYQPWTTDRDSEDYIELESMTYNFRDPAVPNIGAVISWRGDNGELFEGEPEYNDVEQGGVGDCYFLASLSAFAKTNPNIIKQSIVDIGDGTYIVRFYRGGNPVYLKIDGDLPTISNVGGSFLYFARIRSGAWVALLEKAYAFFRFGQNSYSSLSAGWMAYVYQEFNVGANTAWLNSLGEQQIFDEFVQRDAERRAQTTGTYVNPGPALVGGHAYAFYGASGEQLVFYNPWGRDGGSPSVNWQDGLVELTPEQTSTGFSAAVFSDAI